MKIITNNVPRKLKYGYEMPQKLRLDFDYIDPEEFDLHDFVLYRGMWFDFAETVVVPSSEEFANWHSCVSMSYFHGYLFKLVDTETVICGMYTS